MNIYVGNLPFEVTDEELEAAFTEFGEVSSARVIIDRFSGRSRGFGFVEMPTDSEGEAAIAAMNGKEMMGRPLDRQRGPAARGPAEARLPPLLGQKPPRRGRRTRSRPTVTSPAGPPTAAVAASELLAPAAIRVTPLQRDWPPSNRTGTRQAIRSKPYQPAAWPSLRGSAAPWNTRRSAS